MEFILKSSLGTFLNPELIDKNIYAILGIL